VSELKSSNRTPWAHSEGIFEKVTNHPPTLRCTVCGMEISTSALTRASHGKRHVREGHAVARTEYGYDGPRTIYERVTR
jgi:hypothetical protein